MKKFLVMGAALAVAMTTFAAEGERPPWLGKIRKDHPRMFFNRDTWPQLVARAKGEAAGELKSLLARCDKYPTDPVCSGTDNPKPKDGLTVDYHHTGIPPIVEWGTQSAECALAWRFTGKAAYLEKAKAMLRANVKGYQEAYRNGRAVNWYSTTRVNSLCAYDWIHEALTDDERREIIVPLVQHCEDAQPRKGRPSIRRRNTGGVKAGCYGVKNLMWYAGLAALGDGYCDALAEALIVEGHDFHRQVLDFRNSSAGDDGALGTGTPGYAMGVYPVGHFNIFHTWLSATGENLAAEYPAMGLYANWVWWMWIPDAEKPAAPLFLGYGDAFHSTNRLPAWNLYEHFLQYIHFYKTVDPTAARLSATIAARCPGAGRRSSCGFPAYPFLFGPDADVKPFAEGELEASGLKARQFEQLGQIFMRSGWRPDSTYALLVGGTLTPMHKHHDEGSFAIYKHDFLALDSGSRADQTDFNLKYYYGQSVAHNVVLIQKPGEPLPGYWGPSYKGVEGKTNYGGMYGVTSKVVAFETNDRYSYAAVDTGTLYGEKCTENVRQFVHVQPDFFVVYDRVGAADAAYAKQWLLHMQNEPVVNGNVTRADSRGGRLFAETLLPKDATHEVVGGPGKEFWANGRNWEIFDKVVRRERQNCAKDGRGPYWGEWRVETHPGAARKDDRFLHVLTVGDTNALAGVKTRLVEEDGRDGVVLTLPSGEEMTFLFNRTGAVGGEVIRGGVRRPLATTVTPQKGVILDLPKGPFVRGPRTSSEEFLGRHLDLSVSAFRPIPALLASGDVAGAEKVFADFVRQALKPEVYLKDNLNSKPSGKKLRDLTKTAEAVMDYRLSSCGTPCHFKDHRVDWDSNPTFNGYSEWTWQLSRHGFLSTLASYYLATGDERAAKTWADMLGSWFDQATLPPDGTSGYATHCWRNIEAGIRMPEWAYQIHAFLKSPVCTDRFLTGFFRSIWEHGHRVTDVRTFANWRQHELMGLVYISEVYPFLKDANAWRAYALDELEKTFADQIYPDGFQYELTTGYHLAVIHNYRSVIAAYERFGKEPPKFLKAGLEKMYGAFIPMMMPGGNTPALNDGGYVNVAGRIRQAIGDYPHREDFAWVVSERTKGKAPDYLSTCFPYAGAVFFRESWGRDAVAGYMDCSPFGSNHQHEDKLNFTLDAYGRHMIVEAGTYDYDTSDMRRYVVDTRAHNTARVNGLEQRQRWTYKWLSGMISNKADLVFRTTPARDWCGAAYTAGYGKFADKKHVLDKTVHRRSAIFHKDVPEAGPFFVIVDRFEAPDQSPRTYELMWHVEESAFAAKADGFTADFGGGVGLVGAFADPEAKVVNRRGQKEPYFQGWMPIRKSGPHDHRPVDTPVVEGAFTGTRRIVTVLAPYKEGLRHIASVAASNDASARDYTIRFADGTTRTWREPF